VSLVSHAITKCSQHGATCQKISLRTPTGLPARLSTACRGCRQFLQANYEEVPSNSTRPPCVISGFHRGVSEVFALEISRSVDWWLVTDVSGQPIGLDYLTLEDGTNRMSRNVGNYQSTLRNIPQERTSRLPYFLNSHYPVPLLLRNLCR
jgi:hypothetical protein